MAQISRWNGLGEPRADQAPLHGPAQISLRQTRHRGVHRRERGGQLAPGGLEDRVHHRQAHEAAPHLAAHPHPVAHRQRLVVRRVEREKAQQTSVGAIVQRDQQLAVA